MRDQASRAPTRTAANSWAVSDTANPGADTRTDTHTRSVSHPSIKRLERSAMERGAAVAEHAARRIMASVYSGLRRATKKAGLENGL